MNAKIIVKVMNFHALLRVDSAKRKADKVRSLETEVRAMIDLIVNNRNFILDKKSFEVDPSKPVLNLYLGSDFGFCGSINSQVNGELSKDGDTHKIIIGKKLRKGIPGEVLRMTTEAFEKDMSKVEEYLSKSIDEKSYREINLIYNHYYNAGNIILTRKKIFPLTPAQTKESYNDDFVVEGNINELLRNLIKTYLMYEVEISTISSLASENIVRQGATTESLKKIDEKETHEWMMKRKQKTQEQFAKVIDTFVRKKAFKGEEA